MLNLTGIISCSNTVKPTDRKIENDILSRNDLGYLQLDGDSILIPDFEIEVSLSPKAEKKLKEDNETVIVSAMFSGTPKDTLSNEYQFMGISVKNYFSGRRSSENNILDVEILEDKMSVVKGKKYILKGKLIGEDD